MSEISFRVDGNTDIGAGHLQRCLNLAKEFRNHNIESNFIIRPHKDTLFNLISENSFDVSVMNSPRYSISKAKNLRDYKKWMGIDQNSDALETIELSDSKIIVVDHYGIDEEWCSLVQKQCHCLVVFDDMAHLERYDADIIINQTPSFNKSKYANKTNAALLLGSDYTSISKEWKELSKKFSLKENVKSVLFAPGGTDPFKTTEKILDVFQDKFPNLEVNICFRPTKERKHSLIKSFSKNPNFNFHFNKKSIADIASNCDIALGSAGSGTWERALLGMPQIVFSTSYDQNEIINHISKNGLAYIIDLNLKDYKINLINALKNLIEDFSARKTLSEAGNNIFDGNGTQRIYKEIISLHK